MDRLFLYNQEYCDGKDNFDGNIIRYSLTSLVNRNLDASAPIANTQMDALPALYESAALSHSRIVPIGPIEFVQRFLQFEFASNIKMPPLEIPNVLLPFLHREYYTKRGEDITDAECNPENFFVKDIDTLKKFNSLLCLTTNQVKTNIEPKTRYSISQFVVFESEWRVFVNNDDDIRGIECYQGYPVILPDGETIQQMVSVYAKQKHPKAYTLDVGVRFDTARKTLVTEPIEVHPFVAVGLYGFYDTKLLDMWDSGYRWYQAQNVKEN